MTEYAILVGDCPAEQSRGLMPRSLREGDCPYDLTLVQGSNPADYVSADGNDRCDDGITGFVEQSARPNVILVGNCPEEDASPLNDNGCPYDLNRNQ